MFIFHCARALGVSSIGYTVVWKPIIGCPFSVVHQRLRWLVGLNFNPHTQVVYGTFFD
jgi:hypothetical protein